MNRHPFMKLGAAMLLTTIVSGTCLAQVSPAADTLKVHNIFSDHMVLQRDKPIVVWGWAQPGGTVTVKLGQETANPEWLLFNYDNHFRTRVFREYWIWTKSMDCRSLLPLSGRQPAADDYHEAHS